MTPAACMTGCSYCLLNPHVQEFCITVLGERLQSGLQAEVLFSRVAFQVRL